VSVWNGTAGVPTLTTVIGAPGATPGTLGGITQIVGSGLVPNVGDLVAVTFLKALSPDRRVIALIALGTPGGVALVVERH
jgi:hypothetical protein